MKKMELFEMENLAGGRPCVGTGRVTHHYANGCYMNCLQSYFLWIPTGGEYGCDTEATCPGGPAGF